MRTNQVITALFSWYEQHGRHTLPWRKTKDPYKILVSELMLQQTQVPRVIPKYQEFLKLFPTLRELANAERVDVLRAWQGLGYNSRAVRFHALAKLVNEQHGGKLPKTREELLKLPGIGPYTAGAVMIFAHEQPSLSVDVNVERVVCRIFWPQDKIPTRKEVDDLAQKLIVESGRPHAWHCAVMDFGSAICTSKPKCNECPLYKICKSKGSRAEPKAKQSKFAGSTRWWRGQILKVLLEGPVLQEHLLFKIKEKPASDDEEKYNMALDMMKKEGLISKNKTIYLR